MDKKLKSGILAVVVVLALAAMIIPRFLGTTEFKVTPHPATAFETARKTGQPIFLEFYAKW
ncbi:MAG: hypothetical protein M0Z31_13375 [Clostridia bacterium]|nr:hypothetical protein [Clostridia bacterium]